MSAELEMSGSAQSCQLIVSDALSSASLAGAAGGFEGAEEAETTRIKF